MSEHAAAHSKRYMSQICDTVMSCFYRLLKVDKQSNVVECGSGCMVSLCYKILRGQLTVAPIQ